MRAVLSVCGGGLALALVGIAGTSEGRRAQPATAPPIPARPSAQASPREQSTIHFELAGDAYSSVIVVERVVGSTRSRVCTIGGMRSHACELTVSSGTHSFVARPPDDRDGRHFDVQSLAGWRHAVTIDVKHTKTERKGVRTIVSYVTIDVAQSARRMDARKTETAPLDRRDVPVLVIGAIVWLLPVFLGFRTARAKGRSLHWMWFGLNPITAWLVFLWLRYAARQVVRWPPPSRSTIWRPSRRA